MKLIITTLITLLSWGSVGWFQPQMVLANHSLPKAPHYYYNTDWKFWNYDFHSSYPDPTDHGGNNYVNVDNPVNLLFVDHATRPKIYNMLYYNVGQYDGGEYFNDTTGGSEYDFFTALTPCSFACLQSIKSGMFCNQHFSSP